MLVLGSNEGALTGITVQRTVHSAVLYSTVQCARVVGPPTPLQPGPPPAHPLSRPTTIKPSLDNLNSTP